MGKPCHFALFDLQPAFLVDLDELGQRYRELVRSVHPDRFADAPEREQRLALERAAQLNEAYQTLKSAPRRALYLLTLSGHELPLEATVQDPEFLLQQMQLREELEELQDSADLAGVATFKRRLKAAQAELERVFDAQYELTLTEEVEIRYRTETSTDPVTGETTTEEVPYEYYILNVKLTSKPISSVASELLTPEQLEMYQVYRQTLGNKPLIFGGGSPDTSNSEDLTGVVFVNGTRPGNQAVVDIAKSQVGNVGGQPYWSWYGFNSRVEWCACFVSWCYGQMGLSEPRFAACQSQGIPWFQSHGQWGGRDYANIAPGDAIFFDWDLDGSADHVGLVVGTDGSRVYTVEGNSGDACKIKSYSLSYECIKGYGLMNW